MRMQPAESLPKLEALQLNDVHAGLNPSLAARVLRPRTDGELREILRQHWRDRSPLALMGGRHAMGGQQFLSGGTVVDMALLRGVRGFDAAEGRVVVDAGTQWPELLAWLDAHPDNHARWTIRQKQTGADDFSIGGSVAANIHGRGLAFAPFVDDLEWIEVMRADGSVVRASATCEPELFSLVVGGYGLFGVVLRACLRLVRGCTLRRQVRLLRAGEAIAAFEQAVAAGATYGDFQFAIDAASDDFLDLGIQSCYLPVEGAPDPALLRMSGEQFRQLLVLAHTDKTRAFEDYARFYLATDGQRYPPNAQHSGLYLEGYHAAVDRHPGHAGSEMIGEFYVPRSGLAGFLEDAARQLRTRRASVVYGTIRLVEPDTTTVLAWARERWACIVLNLHVRHDPQGLRDARDAFRALNDLALARGGSFYLTYHRWATAAQIETAYPRVHEFLAMKRELDPRDVFQSDWFQHMRSLLGQR